MNAQHPALVIIDMQRGMASSAAGCRNNVTAEQNIQVLLSAWRTAAAPVVHVRHISRMPSSLFWPGQSGVEFQDAFCPLQGEHILEKHVADAFANSGLERWLLSRDILRLVIVGVSTNNSVESTARSAGNLGFRTFVGSDATFCFAKADYDGTSRTAEEVHAMSLSNLQGEYATIAKTDQLLREL